MGSQQRQTIYVVNTSRLCVAMRSSIPLILSSIMHYDIAVYMTACKVEKPPRGVVHVIQ